jgi:hypothetical protein
VTEKSKQRQILAARINFISLCKKGKNKVEAIYKADGTATLLLESMIKAPADFDEKGLLYACVYPAEQEDADGHWATRETIEEMAHEALSCGVQLDLFHDEQPLSPDRAAIVESTIIQNGDTRFGDPSKLAGGWGTVIKIKDPALRKRYREEGWSGVSMAGEAVTTEAAVPEPVNKGFMQSAVRRFSSLFGKADQAPIPDTTTNTDMTTEELTKALDAVLAKIPDLVAQKLQELRKAEAEEAAKAAAASAQTESLTKAQTELAAAQKRVQELEKASNAGDPNPNKPQEEDWVKESNAILAFCKTK